jgi:hypothetical protein
MSEGDMDFEQLIPQPPGTESLQTVLANLKPLKKNFREIPDPPPIP